MEVVGKLGAKLCPPSSPKFMLKSYPQYLKAAIFCLEMVVLGAMTGGGSKGKDICILLAAGHLLYGRDPDIVKQLSSN